MRSRMWMLRSPRTVEISRDSSKFSAKTSALAHLAANAYDVIRALPARLNADVLRRYVREATVQWHLGVFFFGINFWVADKVEAARGYQSAEPAASPFEALWLVEGRPDVSGSGAEAQRLALVVGRGNVEGATGQDGKPQARSVEYVDEVGAALESFAALGAASVHELADVADAVEELAASEGAAEEPGQWGTSCSKC